MNTGVRHQGSCRMLKIHLSFSHIFPISLHNIMFSGGSRVHTKRSEIGPSYCSKKAREKRSNYCELREHFQNPFCFHFKLRLRAVKNFHN